MGMTIDEAIEHGKEQLDIFGGEHKEFIEISIDTMRKYQMMQADYENRLKADMVAILTEIQMDIREYHEIGCDEDCNNCRMVGCVEPVNVIKDLDIIQQKINSIKAENEDKEC